MLLSIALNFNCKVSIGLANKTEWLSRIEVSASRLNVYRYLQMLDVSLDFLISKVAANQTLEGKDGIDRVGDGLSLGKEADETFTMPSENNDCRGCPPPSAFSMTLAAVPSITRVGGTQVNTDDYYLQSSVAVVVLQGGKNVPGKSAQREVSMA